MIRPMNGLFIQSLQTEPRYFFAVVITVIVSITLHELAHGFVAIKLGDDTPAVTGHMTLNPLVHMGLFSFVLLAIAGIAYGAMPVNRSRLRGRYAESLVAVAGPVTNLLLAVIATVGLGLWYRFGTVDVGVAAQANGLLLLSVFAITNFALAIFNMLPVPPLDGGYIAANLFPAYRRLLSGDMARGFLSAVTIALFLGGGTFIFSGAYSAYFGLGHAAAGGPIYPERTAQVQADAD